MVNNNSAIIYFNELPVEIIVEVLGYLDHRTLRVVSEVNLSLQKIVESFFIKKKNEEEIKYDILLEIHKRKVSSNPKIETFLFHYGFFGKNIEHLLTNKRREKIPPYGLVPNDYRYRDGCLSRRDALVAYLELKQKADMFSGVEERIGTNNNQNKEDAFLYLARQEAKKRFLLLVIIELLSKLCFDASSVLNYSGYTFHGTESDEVSMEKELNRYLEVLKQTEPNVYEEFKQFANSIHSDILNKNSVKKENQIFLKSMLDRVLHIRSINPISRSYQEKVADNFLREIQRVGFENYSESLKQKIDEKQQEIEKLFESHSQLPLVKACFAKSKNLKDYVTNYLSILLLDDPIEIMVADIIDSTPALKSKEGEDNTIKKLSDKLWSYNILNEGKYSDSLPSLIESMKLLYVLDESVYFESILNVLSNLIQNIWEKNKKLDIYQLKAIQTILGEVFNTNLKFYTISKIAFTTIATQNSNVEVPFIDFVCTNFSGYFDNRLIKRISLLMSTNENLENVQHPILQLFKKCSYLPPAAAALFTPLKFDSVEEKMDAIFQFLERIPDYKYWKENPLIAHNFKSDAFMKKTGQSLLLYILDIPLDVSNNFKNNLEKHVRIDQENIHLLLPFIDLFMKKFPSAISQDDFQAIQTWTIENHRMDALKFFVFNEFRQVGFSSKLIDLLNFNESFSCELIKLIKNPEESFFKTNYFTFENLPKEFESEEIALIMLERELRGIRTGNNIPFIMKGVEAFCARLDSNLIKELKLKMARKLIEVCVEMNDKIKNCGLLTHHHFRAFTENEEEIVELYRHLIEKSPEIAKSLKNRKETEYLYCNFTNQRLEFHEEPRLAQLEDKEFKQYHDQIKEMIDTVSKPKKRPLQEKNLPRKRQKKV